MINHLKKIFGFGPTVNISELINSGAVILDVRTKGEYAGGHVKGSVNIPLDQLHSKAAEFDKDKPVVTCCASGIRSASAKNILRAKGFKQVHNGGSWISVKNKMQK